MKQSVVVAVVALALALFFYARPAVAKAVDAQSSKGTPMLNAASADSHAVQLKKDEVKPPKDKPKKSKKNDGKDNDDDDGNAGGGNDGKDKDKDKDKD